MKHTFVAELQDQPGVLSRVANLFWRRAFDLTSINVGSTEDPSRSRMTIVVDARRTSPERVAANLRKLVPVVEVTDLTGLPAVSRDLALVRVRCAPTERSELRDVAAIFRARIVDLASDSAIVEVSGDEEKVDGLVELLRPRGILEMVRSGRVAMRRGGGLDKNGADSPRAAGH